MNQSIFVGILVAPLRHTAWRERPTDAKRISLWHGRGISRGIPIVEGIWQAAYRYVSVHACDSYRCLDPDQYKRVKEFFELKRSRTAEGERPVLYLNHLIRLNHLKNLCSTICKKC